MFSNHSKALTLPTNIGEMLETLVFYVERFNVYILIKNKLYLVLWSSLNKTPTWKFDR